MHRSLPTSSGRWACTPPFRPHILILTNTHIYLRTLTPLQNLSKDLGYTNRASLVTLAVTSLLIGASVGIQVLIKFVQALYTPDNLVKRGIELEADQATVYTFLLSALASTVVIVVNLLLKWTIKYFVSLEGHDTKTDFEIRIFTMLSMAYVLNTVVMPMALGALPFGVRSPTLLDAKERLGFSAKVAYFTLLLTFR